ncbi:uncharacterized protein H6S33_000318 [Morchella sextelata]|uniref:uncharacterized protein n=1 Tax=Morchella sextelata TaxID=1174677 RepID=UPI001D0550AC|nr:uncharacterized protein H6S33_000318 [Morchella sextelata]KAH0614682.1 hypothetical protein H6S33_000318 [Morchella sextelata]
MSETGTPAPETRKARHEKVAFRFCRECSNMLYPHEDRLNNTLLYRCRTCQATEAASNYCVFRNVLGGSAGETAGVTTDVGSDPTLPRASKPCPYCNETEAVFFQSQQRTEDTKMRLFHVCCTCGQIHENYGK